MIGEESLAEQRRLAMDGDGLLSLRVIFEEAFQRLCAAFNLTHRDGLGTVNISEEVKNYLGDVAFLLDLSIGESHPFWKFGGLFERETGQLFCVRQRRQVF